MLVNVQGHPFGIFLATLKNSGKIPTFVEMLVFDQDTKNMPALTFWL